LGSASDERQPSGKERSDAERGHERREGSASDERQPSGKERSDAERGHEQRVVDGGLARENG
jgi:hypothetical protein